LCKISDILRDILVIDWWKAVANLVLHLYTASTQPLFIRQLLLQNY